MSLSRRRPSSCEKAKVEVSGAAQSYSACGARGAFVGGDACSLPFPMAPHPSTPIATYPLITSTETRSPLTAPKRGIPTPLGP
jgi:hypothetical protein